MTSSHQGLWKSSSLLVLILLAALVAGAQQESSGKSLKELFGVTGSLRAAEWSNDRSYSSDRMFGVGSGWLTLRPQEVGGMKTYFDGYIQGQNFSKNSNAQGDVREAYLETSLGAFDFKVGRAITVWGRADKVNPTDNLTTRNYKLLMTDDEDQRMGLFSAQAVYNVAGLRLIGIWIPEWRSPVYPLPPVAGVSFSDNPPDQVWQQAGFKVDSSGGTLDWSASYFHGYSKAADLRFISAGASGVSLAFNYGLIDVYGLDFATSGVGFGFRGEVAYTKTQDLDGIDPLTQNSHLDAVLGVERSFFDEFNVIAQGMYKHMYNYQSINTVTNPSIYTIAKQLNVINNQLAADEFGFTLRPSYKMFNETLEMEIAWVMWFTQGDSLVNPKVTYAFNDHFKGSVGALLYNGPGDSFFGELTNTSAGYAEMRYNF